MSNTVFIDVPDGTWTEILAISLTALISNEGQKSIRIVEATAAPADAVQKGHTVHPGAYRTMTTPVAGKIFAQGVGGPSKVAVTSA